MIYFTHKTTNSTTVLARTKQAQEALCPSRKRNVPGQERKDGLKEGRREGRKEGREERIGKTEVSIPAGSQRNELVPSLYAI